MDTKLIQKSIRLPAKAVQIIEEDVREKLGIDFNDYIKNVVITKANEVREERAKYMAGLEKDILAAREAHSKGETKILRTSEDIDKFIDEIINEPEDEKV